MYLFAEEFFSEKIQAGTLQKGCISPVYPMYDCIVLYMPSGWYELHRLSVAGADIAPKDSLSRFHALGGAMGYYGTYPARVNPLRTQKIKKVFLVFMVILCIV